MRADLCQQTLRRCRSSRSSYEQPLRLRWSRHIFTLRAALLHILETAFTLSDRAARSCCRCSLWRCGRRTPQRCIIATWVALLHGRCSAGWASSRSSWIVHAATRSRRATQSPVECIAPSAVTRGMTSSSRPPLPAKDHKRSGVRWPSGTFHRASGPQTRSRSSRAAMARLIIPNGSQR